MRCRTSLRRKSKLPRLARKLTELRRLDVVRTIFMQIHKQPVRTRLSGVVRRAVASFSANRNLIKYEANEKTEGNLMGT